MSSADDRISDLERRLTALEDQAASTPAVEGDSPSALDSDTFWALEGLRARVTSPGAVLITGHVDTPTGGVAQWQEGAEVQDLLDDEWDRAADALAALGHPVRVRLVRGVLRGATTVRALTEIDGLGSTGQVYHHLRLLVSAGWLRSRSGSYEVPAERVVPLLTMILGGRR